MAEHKLPKGKSVIRGLKELGKSLGYHVRCEFPVGERTHGHAPAVDVAWFSDGNQSFPLMIFEVESAAGNTIANNPLKIFAQPSTEFEKPLFYFQIIVSGEANSSRVKLLEEQYGKFNYRLYRLGRRDGKRLLLDILGQHRRIRSEIEYCKVFHVLADVWADYADPIPVLEEAHRIGLSAGTQLSDYVWLALTEEPIRQQLPNLLELDAHENWNSVCDIETYMAKCYGPILMCAWLIGYQEDSVDFWEQELAKFGLGLNQNAFALTLGGAFLGCLFALCKGKSNTIQKWLDELRSVLENLPVSEHGLHVAVWMSHVSAMSNRPDDFEAAQDFIEAVGGIPERCLLTPPSHCAVEADIREEYFSGEPSRRLSLTEFSEAASELHRNKAVDRSAIAFRVINFEGYLFDWAMTF